MRMADPIFHVAQYFQLCCKMHILCVLTQQYRPHPPRIVTVLGNRPTFASKRPKSSFSLFSTVATPRDVKFRPDTPHCLPEGISEHILSPHVPYQTSFSVHYTSGPC